MGEGTKESEKGSSDEWAQGVLGGRKVNDDCMHGICTVMQASRVGWLAMGLESFQGRGCLYGDFGFNLDSWIWFIVLDYETI